MTLTDEQKGWIEDSARVLAGTSAHEIQFIWQDQVCSWVVRVFKDFNTVSHTIHFTPHIPGPAGAWDREQIRHACGVTHSPRLNNDGTGYLIGVSIYEYKTPEEEALAHVQAGAEVWRARNSERYSFVTYGKGKK